ncbi:MAG: hypothetical protein V4582_24955 [Pseudomonadota bacterium]
MRLLIFMALLLALPAQATESRFVSHWEASCDLPAHKLDMAFHSKSGDPTDDDMSVTLAWDGKKGATLPLKPALFVAMGSLSDAKMACPLLNVFQFPSGNILLLLTRDDRPSEDRIAAILLDGHTGSTIDVLDDLGEYSGVLNVLRDGAGFRALMNRRWLVDATGREFAAVDWLVIKEGNGRIIHDWETARN